MPLLLHPKQKPVKVYRSAGEWLAKEHGSTVDQNKPDDSKNTKDSVDKQR
jgi:hypothetical protein